METHFPFTDLPDAAARREQLVADLKVVVHDIENLLKSTAGQISQQAAADLQGVLNRSKQLCAQLEARASARLKQADQVIREHPYQSIGIAFAAGLLIGVLVNRR